MAMVGRRTTKFAMRFGSANLLFHSMTWYSSSLSSREYFVGRGGGGWGEKKKLVLCCITFGISLRIKGIELALDMYCARYES